MDGGVSVAAVGGERGTEDVRAVLEHAEREALTRGADEVSSVDLLLAVLAKRPGHTGPVLERHHVAREALERSWKGGCGGANGAGGSSFQGAVPAHGPLPPAAEVAAAVSQAMRRAAHAGRDRFDAEDLLLAVLEDRAAQASRVIDKMGIDRGRMRGDLEALRGQAEAIARATAAHEPCPFHVGPGACSAGSCGTGAAGPCGPLPAVPGLGGEVRDLGARFDALIQNHDMLRERVEDLVRYLRVVWAGSLILLAAVAVLAWKVFART